MFSLGSTRKSSDRIARALVFLSLCPAFPLPAQSIETLADTGGRTVSGPGWYDSSWDLSCGLEIAEVPDLDDWIGACQADDSSALLPDCPPQIDHRHRVVA